MRWLARFGALPVVLAVLTIITAVQYVLIAFTNLTDYGTNESFVDHVFAMDTTFLDPDLTWRSITSNVVVTIAYIGIIIWQGLTALVLVLAAVSWFSERWTGHGFSGRYELARRLSSLGWAMVLVLYLGGFMVIGGEWFAMWQSNQFNGLAAAFQNVMVAAVGLILVHLPKSDSRWVPPDSDSAHREPAET